VSRRLGRPRSTCHVQILVRPPSLQLLNCRKPRSLRIVVSAHRIGKSDAQSTLHQTVELARLLHARRHQRVVVSRSFKHLQPISVACLQSYRLVVWIFITARVMDAIQPSLEPLLILLLANAALFMPVSLVHKLVEADG
jgi:hypothetical protein